MIDSSSVGIIIAVILLFLGFSIMILSIKIFSGKAYTKRLSDFVTSNLNDAAGRGMISIPEDYHGSIISRTIAPFFHKIILSLGRLAPKRSNEALKKKLSIAGNPYGLKVMEFNGIRLLFIIIGVLAFLQVTGGGASSDTVLMLSGLGIVLILSLLPGVWLNSRVKIIKDDIRIGFPDVMDMLSVCAYAGLGFDQALQRVADIVQTPLGVEIRRVVKEIELGVSRSDALKTMSERLEISDISSFVAIITQAEKLGMSIADVLHAQAEQMRIIRQFRAKEIANRLPAKMLVPLAIFILPALFAIIFAPILPTIINFF